MDGRAVLVIVAVILGILGGPIWYLGNTFLVTSKITLHHVTFWSLLLFVPVVLYLVDKYKRKGMFPRLIVVLWPAFLFVYYTTGVYFSSGIADVSNFNGQVVSGVWSESYTTTRTETICDSTDKDGKCTSEHTVTHCDVYHSDSYTISFSDGSDHSIGNGNYRNLVRQLANEKQVSNYNFGQCSIGDGRKFATTYIQGKSADLYVTYEEPIVNYILAGHNLYQTSSEVARPHIDRLEKIPGISEHPAGIGPWMSHRIITKGVQVPEAWKQTIDHELNKLNGTLGPAKKVNVVMYVVDAPSREFTTALDAHWVHGRKNQLTIVVGSRTFPKIDWVDVLDFWSTNPGIRINLRDQLEKLTLDDPSFMKVVHERVVSDWQRNSMKTFEYLSWELTLPWWFYPLVLIWCLAVSVFFSRLLEEAFD